MTKLIITRNSEWNNRARDYGIYIDDKKIGTIANGETKEFDLDSGIHKINGKIDWCKSPKIEFEIAENDSKKIEISGYNHGKIISRISFGLLIIYFSLKYLFKIELEILIIFIGIGLLFPLYYITFGKNQYLRLIELN